LHRKINWMIS